jgi:hypothetical protein
MFSVYLLAPKRRRRIRRTATRTSKLLKRLPLARRNVPTPKLPAVMPETAARPPPRKLRPNHLRAPTPRRRSAIASRCWLQQGKHHARYFPEPRKCSEILTSDCEVSLLISFPYLLQEPEGHHLSGQHPEAHHKLHEDISGCRPSHPSSAKHLQPCSPTISA